MMVAWNQGIFFDSEIIELCKTLFSKWASVADKIKFYFLILKLDALK